MQLWIIKIAHIKKLQVCARPWDIGLISMYEAVLLFFYCWQFIVLKNRPQCSSIKILHSLTNDKQTCLLQSPFKLIFPICFYQSNFVIKIYKWFTIFQWNSFIKIAISHLIKAVMLKGSSLSFLVFLITQKNLPNSNSTRKLNKKAILWVSNIAWIRFHLILCFQTDLFINHHSCYEI